MKKFVVLKLSLILSAVLLVSGCNLLCEVIDCEDIPEPLKKVGEVLTDTYIVGLAGGPAEVVEDINIIQTAVASIYDFEPIHIFKDVTQGFSVELPWAARNAVLELDEVEYIKVDPSNTRVFPEHNAPEFGNDEVPEDIARIGGPATVNLTGVEVAVVDTGVDLDHPDLNVVGSFDAVGEAGGEDSGGDDLNGHGTHVAGTIGAIADSNGVVGVAPGVGIHAVRVLDRDGGGTLGDIIAGLEYVMQHPEIKVVNMSLGGAGDTSNPAPLKEAIQTLEANGVVVCIAAGNEGDNTDNYIPAGYDVGVIVSAYDSHGGDNGFADFSNYGDDVDIAAPGVDITSTYPEGEYASLSGTSMATPHVAGAAAAYMAANPSATADDAKSALLQSAEDNYSGQGGDHPESLLDVAELLN